MRYQNKIIFIIGRDNWQRDDALNHLLLQHLKKTNHDIIWEDPAGEMLYKLRRFENKVGIIPNYIRTINLRLVQLIYGCFHWSYFQYLSNRRNESVELRTRKTKESILKLGDKKEIIVLSRSAGGRFSSRIADNLKIKHLICLGYPFKHPDKGNEPDRYLHLNYLRTPMLIIQGDKDEYGGLEVKNKYALSPNIELLFVDTNHDFKVSTDDWKRILCKIDDIIN